VLHSLTAAINIDTTGNRQDCLGMTPLHILACSSVHDLELYRMIVENYLTNLITEDIWGALPLLYEFWGAAPSEIIQIFLASYKSLYPYYEFNLTNWFSMWKQMHFPESQLIGSIYSTSLPGLPKSTCVKCLFNNKYHFSSCAENSCLQSLA